MSIDVLVTVHPEPLAAAGLAGGSDIELRACVGFPDHDHVRLTFHGPQDRLDALAAALSGGSVTLPAEPPARETQPIGGAAICSFGDHDGTFDEMSKFKPDLVITAPTEPKKRRGRPRKPKPALVVFDHAPATSDFPHGYTGTATSD